MILTFAPVSQSFFGHHRRLLFMMAAASHLHQKEKLLPYRINEPDFWHVVSLKRPGIRDISQGAVIR
jgi:hypothetical protein